MKHFMTYITNRNYIQFRILGAILGAISFCVFAYDLYFGSDGRLQMAWFWAALAAGAQGAGSGMGGYYGKKNEESIAKYNAALMRQEKAAIKIRTKFQQERTAEESARIEGEIRSALGGSGTVTTQGAPLLALALQKSESDLQNYLIGYEGRIEAGQAESKALEFDMLKRMARSGSRLAWIGAGTSAVQGYSQWTRSSTQPSSTGSASYGGGTGTSGWTMPQRESSYLSAQGVGR
jgi:hypothetical protein